MGTINIINTLPYTMLFALTLIWVLNDGLNFFKLFKYFMIYIVALVILSPIMFKNNDMDIVKSNTKVVKYDKICTEYNLYRTKKEMENKK